VAEVHQLLETEEVEDLRFDRDTRSWLPPPGPQMAKFVAELEKGWPSLDDPEGSPWSSWPLWAPVAGGGTGLNIGWSWAASAMPAIPEIAARTNVVIYDPQAAKLIRPREACN
jgi:hypothetical protein